MGNSLSLQNTLCIPPVTIIARLELENFAGFGSETNSHLYLSTVKRWLPAVKADFQQRVFDSRKLLADHLWVLRHAWQGWQPL